MWPLEVECQSPFASCTLYIVSLRVCMNIYGSMKMICHTEKFNARKGSWARIPSLEPIFNHTRLTCQVQYCIFLQETEHITMPMKVSEHVLIAYLSVVGSTRALASRGERAPQLCFIACCLQSFERVIVKAFRRSPLSTLGQPRGGYIKSLNMKDCRSRCLLDCSVWPRRLVMDTYRM